MLAVEDLPVGLETDDVESYLSARDISSAVYAPGIMEYWKSTPYFLSFAEQYRVYAGWLRDASRANATGDVDDAEHSVWGGLVANVQDGLADPSRLGRPPTISSICWRYSLWDRRQMLRYEHSLASLGYPLRDRVWKGKRLQRRGIPLVLPVSHFRRSLAQPILSLRALQYANLCAKGTRVYSRGRFVGSPGRVFPCAPGIKWRSVQRIRPGGFAVRSSEIGHWAVGRNRVGKTVLPEYSDGPIPCVSTSPAATPMNVLPAMIPRLACMLTPYVTRSTRHFWPFASRHYFGRTGGSGLSLVLPCRRALELAFEPCGSGTAGGPCPSLSRAHH